MTVTSTNRTDISYVLESTPGTTPATPAFQLLPTTGGAPSGNLSTEISKVIRSDRAVDDLIVVDSMVGADAINFELSYTPLKPIFDALLQNTTINTVAITTVTTISVTASTFASLPVNFVTANVKVGQIIKTSGFANAANNGYFRVTGVATGAITVDATLTVEATGASVTIKTVSRANGTNTPSSYSFCKRVQGITTPVFFYYTGCQISQLVLNYALGAILGGSFGLKGLVESATVTGIAGQSFVAIPAYTIMNAATSVKLAKIYAAGLTGTAKFESASITINNNITPAKQVGVLGATDLASYTLDITGDIRIYFEEVAQYNLFLNSTSFALVLVAEDSTPNAFAIHLPRCKFTALEPPIDGKDNFLMLNGSFRALYDTPSACQVMFNHI